MFTISKKQIPVSKVFGGTGKKDQGYTWVVGPSNQYQLSAAELQSIITRNASVIEAYESEQKHCKKMLVFCSNQLGTREAEHEAYYQDRLNYFRKFLGSVKKTLSILRKIQTKLKRQRANL